MQAFDHISSTYDQNFTYTTIGQHQRRRVWKYLDRILRDDRHRLRILEINCGTGEDALYMKRFGHYVMATDISSGMLNQAKKKADDLNLEVDYQVLDITSLSTLTTSKKFDFIFSNFGGLNCLNREQLVVLPDVFKNLLARNGHVVLVLMPRHCIIEDLYFLMKGKFKHLNRRNSDMGNTVLIDDIPIKTYYHDPDFLRRNFLNNGYRAYKSFAIGFFPSYFNTYLNRNQHIDSVCKSLERMAMLIPGSCRVADHYLSHFQLRESFAE